MAAWCRARQIFYFCAAVSYLRSLLTYEVCIRRFWMEGSLKNPHWIGIMKCICGVHGRRRRGGGAWGTHPLQYEILEGTSPLGNELFYENFLKHNTIFGFSQHFQNQVTEIWGKIRVGGFGHLKTLPTPSQNFVAQPMAASFHLPLDGLRSYGAEKLSLNDIERHPI